MKKILCTILCLCVILSIFPASAFGASAVSIYNVTVDDPIEGTVPSNTGKMPDHASTYVTNVKWSGNFNANGAFIKGETYTVEVTIRIKDGQDKYVTFSAKNAKINGNLASKVSISDDEKSITLKCELKSEGSTVANTPTSKYNELSLHEFEWEVLRLCNIERAKENLPAFSTIGTLQACCDVREKEIITLFSHTRPDGTDFSTVIPSSYQWEIISENIASGQPTPEVVVESWMNSPGHRANILNPEHIYMGVGYNPNQHGWVQIFANSKEITDITTNAPSYKLSESEILKYYLEIKASNGYISYMPTDFSSMKKIGTKYYPRINKSVLPEFEKVEETPSSPSSQGGQSEVITTAPAKKAETAAGGIFQRYIPISQMYGADFSVGLNMKVGDSVGFTIGTQFVNENEYGGKSLKRSEYQNHFVKLNYLGTYGTLDEKTVLVQLGIINADEYKKVMNGEPSDWAKAYNLTKDTIVVSIDLYDANKNFVKTISPASVIAAVGDDGSFVTYARFYNLSSTNYFTQLDNLYLPDEDKSNGMKRLRMTTANLMVSDLSVVENLLAPVAQEEFSYTKHPELTGNRQYNTNHILSDEEFVTPNMAYYQVSKQSGKIDPVVKNEIKNVVSYSYYLHSLGVGYTQRNIVTSDGTLYGVSSSYDKKTIATNVKKTTANHYLTKNGDVKEIKSGNTVATDCFNYEESNDGQVIGIIKNDKSFYLGYTCVEGGDGYKRGLTKMLDNAKVVVPNGVIDGNNDFYRWDNKVTMTGIDMNAFYSGQVKQSYSLELSIIKVCSNAQRVFPYEYLTKVLTSDTDIKKYNIYGFVQSSDGTLHGYSLTYHQSFGSYGKIERIFPVYTGVSVNEGNFVGMKVENEPTPYAIVCRYCDNNTYRWGRLVNEDGTNAAAYVCETQGGYYSTDGKVYGTESNPPNSHAKNATILCATNIITNFPQMHRGTATYGAYRRDKNESIPLLPSVYTWYNDNKGITLLERTDGSMWMAYALNPSSVADLVAKTGGYESSNVIQVSPATPSRKNVEYIEPSGAYDPFATGSRFIDVAADAWYATPVQWAVDKSITVGTTDTTFEPNLTCTRAQIITFLWRAVGSPKASGTNPFTDVNSTDYFYDAAIWASRKGIVSGSTFAPTTPCTRAETVTYLWKNAGAPAQQATSSFSDVAYNASYAQAVVWAVNNNITSGMSATEFMPDVTCTRGQIVTFLNRALK